MKRHEEGGGAGGGEADVEWLVKVYRLKQGKHPVSAINDNNDIIIINLDS